LNFVELLLSSKLSHQKINKEEKVKKEKQGEKRKSIRRKERMD